MPELIHQTHEQRLTRICACGYNAGRDRMSAQRRDPCQLPSSRMNAQPPNRPPAHGGRPPVEDLRALQIGPHAFLPSAQRRSTATCCAIRSARCPSIWSADPDGVKHVLQDNATQLQQGHLPVQPAEHHHRQRAADQRRRFLVRQRRLAQPAFHRQRIADFGPLMTGATEAMLADWRPYAEVGQAIDVAAEMMHVALQIVGKALFSVEIGDRADALARATLTVLDHIVFRAKTFGIVPAWLPTPRQPARTQRPAHARRAVRDDDQPASARDGEECRTTCSRC